MARSIENVKALIATFESDLAKLSALRKNKRTQRVIRSIELHLVELNTELEAAREYHNRETSELYVKGD